MFASPLTMFDAVDVNATQRPSPLRDGWSLPPFAWLPSKPTLTRVVVFAWRSRMKMSFASLVSPSTRFDAAVEKATKRPSSESAGAKLSPFASTPALLTLTRSVSPVWRSRTKTSRAPFVSPWTRFDASE